MRELLLSILSMKENLGKQQLLLPLVNPAHKQSLQYTFALLKNDWSQPVTESLIEVKNLIGKGLPSMSKSHIVRLVMDTRHQSIVIKQQQEIVGVITFRVFEAPNIAQIAFLVVKYEKRIKGYGKKLINKLKSEMQKRNIEYLLTFGDQNALGFFRKQGFTQKLTLSHERWDGYIKEYEGGKFMQCKIYKNIDYENIDSIIKKQKEYLIEVIKQRSSNEIEFCGTDIPERVPFERKRLDGKIQKYAIDPRRIPGVIEGGWTWQEHDQLRNIEEVSLQQKLELVMRNIVRHPDAWPFKEPVTQKQAWNYFEVIKQPMDLKKISQKLKEHKYQNLDQFIKDFQLMFSNCKQYNSVGSLYHKIAIKLENKYIPVLHKLRQGVITNSLKLL